MSCLTQNKAKLWKNLIITLVFFRKTPFFAKKLAKIASKTSTPDTCTIFKRFVGCRYFFNNIVIFKY
jgi:hypothetical protein